jgi:cobalt/nickel transport protein
MITCSRVQKVRPEEIMRFFRVSLVLVVTATSPARAHFSMLLPQVPACKKGEAVTVVYQWGHPFEHQVFDALPPVRLQVMAPDGKGRVLTKFLEKTKVKGDGKDVAVYQFQFTPPERGDYTFLLNTPPIWMPEEREFLQDTVKVVLHVQAQKGWDAADDQQLQIVPLTRPYGLQAGMVFQARVLDQPAIGFGGPMPGKPAVSQPGLPVFIERYNPQPPKVLPPDELITFTAKTDPNGVVTCTLPSAGWWCIAAQRDAGRRPYEGKNYPVRQRVILWVHVNDAVK